MAQFEIDIDLCIKDRKPFRVANADKTVRKGVMASCLGELQWLAKQKLNLKSDAKVSLFLEKDGTEVEEQSFFEKLSDHTRFIAKEVPNNGCRFTKKLSNVHSVTLDVLLKRT